MRMDIADEFEKFHRENPDVFRSLVSLAREAKHAGQHKYGIAALFEVLRWDRMMKKRPGEEFKLANAHRAFYARLIMRKCADLKSFFDIAFQPSQVGKSASGQSWDSDDDVEERRRDRVERILAPTREKRAAARARAVERTAALTRRKP